jgi:hypothetical protein
MATARQIAANQANSLRSTGPRSPSGKAASRANSYKHGLTGRGVVLPHQEAEVVEERFVSWCGSLRPRDDFGAWLVETIAFESVRVDRCRLHEVALRLRMVDRAEDFWPIDRKLAAAQLAARLPRSPETIALELEHKLQGVELLIGRWEALGKTLAMTGTWSESQRSEALDLLGVRRDRREGWTELVPDPGDFLTEAQWFGQHVECRLRDLRALRSRLEEHDAAERLRAMAGDASPSDAELKRLRRYERGCLRTLQWAVALLKARKKDGLPGPEDDQPWTDDPTSTAPQEPEHPEFAEEPFGDGPLDVSAAQAVAIPGSAVAAPHEKGLDDGEAAVPAGSDDVVEAAPARGLLTPVPLASAVRPSEPGNRRARRAARRRNRKR